MKTIKIGDRIIGDGRPCFIIAEAGINHNGNLEIAKQLVDSAAKAGADAVKFQIYKAEEFCSTNSEYFDTFKSIEFSTDEWTEISEYAIKRDIIFTASVFGEESADLLDALGSQVFKIASGDLTHYPLLRYIAKKKKPIILSTGMSDIGEINDALNEIYSMGNRNVALLHCVSNYPTKYEEANLFAIKTMKECFKIPVGFSDHTIGITIPIAAVASGANIIEKHFTLDKNMEGPDHKLSLDPDEFRQMVKNIKYVEWAMGDGIKRPTKEEEEIKKVARRSVVAKIDIPEGAIITTEDMFDVKRPGTGIEPKYMERIVGKRARIDIKEGDLITWEMI